MSNYHHCEPCPFYMALSHVRTRETDYYVVYHRISACLLHYRVPYEYDATTCSFECTQMYDDGQERVDCITIFWDDVTKEHVVEVRRLKGDTLIHCEYSNKHIRRIFDDMIVLFSV